MAEYLFLFRGGDEARAREQQSPEKWKAFIDRMKQWMKDLDDDGKFVSTRPLKNAGKQVKGKEKIVTDGPFVEGKEIVGGYVICRAENLDEAVELSKGCPLFEHDGLIEVRELGEFKF
jgi:hypothetical protein